MNNIQQLQTTSRVQRLSFISFSEESKPAPESVAEIMEVQEKVIQAVEPAIELPLITEEEVRAARNEGFAEGYKEGFTKAEAKADKEAAKREEGIKAVMELIANRITLAAEDHVKYIDSRQEIMKGMAIGIARKIAGDAMKSEPYSAAEAVLKECFALIVNEPKVIITVSEPLCAGMKQRIDSLRPLLPGFNGELVVEGSAELSENDCRVEWKNGYAEHDTAKLWSDVETIIAKIGKL